MGNMIGNLMGSDGLIVIIVALVVLVGGSQLPKIARNVGLAGKEFRKAQSEAEEERKTRAEASVAPPVPLPASPAPTISTPAPTISSPAPPAASPAPPAASPAPPVPAASPTPPVPAASGVDAGVSNPPSDEASINLTPAQLDALLRAREQQVRNEAGLN